MSSEFSMLGKSNENIFDDKRDQRRDADKILWSDNQRWPKWSQQDQGRNGREK